MDTLTSVAARDVLDTTPAGARSGPTPLSEHEVEAVGGGQSEGVVINCWIKVAGESASSACQSAIYAW